MITRVAAIQNLKKYIGRDLSYLGKEFGVTIILNGKINKGWKGLILERCAGLDNNNKSAPNGIGFELKSVSFVEKEGHLTSKETMAITMLNPEKLKKQDFYESGLWDKLKSLVFCAVEWKGANVTNVKLLHVTSFDFQDEQTLIDEIKEDYDFMRDKLIKQGFESLTGRDGKWIQARTKGAGHGSTTRAFYAKKSLVNYIFQKQNLSK